MLLSRGYKSEQKAVIITPKCARVDLRGSLRAQRNHKRGRNGCGKGDRAGIVVRGITYRLGQPLRRSSSTVSNPWQAAGLKLRMSGHGGGDQPKRDPGSERRRAQMPPKKCGFDPEGGGNKTMITFLLLENSIVIKGKPQLLKNRGEFLDRRYRPRPEEHHEALD